MMFPKSPAVESPVPTVCPTCQSSAIATASKVIDEGSYWRCQTCGDVWNPARMVASPTVRRYGLDWRSGG